MKKTKKKKLPGQPFPPFLLQCPIGSGHECYIEEEKKRSRGDLPPPLYIALTTACPSSFTAIKTFLVTILIMERPILEPVLTVRAMQGGVDRVSSLLNAFQRDRSKCLLSIFDDIFNG